MASGKTVPLLVLWAVLAMMASFLFDLCDADHSKYENRKKLFKHICSMSTTEDGLQVISNCVDEHASEMSKKIMSACKKEVFSDETNSEIMTKLCTDYDVMMKYIKCHFKERTELKHEKHPESKTAENRKDFREQRKRLKKCLMTSGGYRR